MPVSTPRTSVIMTIKTGCHGLAMTFNSTNCRPMSWFRMGINTRASKAASTSAMKASNIDSKINCVKSCPFFAPMDIPSPVSIERRIPANVSGDGLQGIELKVGIFGNRFQDARDLILPVADGNRVVNGLMEDLVKLPPGFFCYYDRI